VNPKRLGILGYPLNHSLSPRLWRAYARETGLSLAYVPVEARPPHLPDLSAYDGLHITQPWKIKVITHLHLSLHGSAREVGAVNVIRRLKDTHTWIGYNTDVSGFLEGLRMLRVSPGRAVILGTGGAARACAVALDRVRFSEVILVSRHPERTAPGLSWAVVSYADLHHPAFWDPVTLLVQATPLSWKNLLPPVPWDLVPEGVAGYDLAYRMDTPFLRTMMRLGPVVDGTPMLLGQALESGPILLGDAFDPQRFREVFHRVMQEVRP